MKLTQSVSTPGRLLWLIPLALWLLALPQLGAFVANRLNFQIIDPHGAFGWISVHHLVQGFLGLVTVMLLWKILPRADFGFRLIGKTEFSSWLKKFLLWFAFYTLFSWLLGIALSIAQPFAYPLTVRNILGQLSFQLLLSGPAEEIIFRSLAIGSILALFGIERRPGLWGVNGFAALVFALAHLGINFSTGDLSWSTVQMLYAFAMGLVYGYAFLSSGSVLLPMVLHSLSNVIAVSTVILYTSLRQGVLR